MEAITIHQLGSETDHIQSWLVQQSFPFVQQPTKSSISKQPRWINTTLLREIELDWRMPITSPQLTNRHGDGRFPPPRASAFHLRNFQERWKKENKERKKERKRVFPPEEKKSDTCNSWEERGERGRKGGNPSVRIIFQNIKSLSCLPESVIRDFISGGICFYTFNKSPPPPVPSSFSFFIFSFFHISFCLLNSKHLI